MSEEAMGRASMAKDLRRQMRRAMGEHAVQQVEHQTAALGVHEQRFEWQTMELAKLRHEIDIIRNALLPDIEKRLDTDNRRINDLVLRVGDLERESNLWTRLRWLISGK